jgi:hypothetical protein
VEERGEQDPGFERDKVRRRAVVRCPSFGYHQLVFLRDSTWSDAKDNIHQDRVAGRTAATVWKFSIAFAPANEFGGKGSVMLTPRSPSAITTMIICIECGGRMPLALIEPAYTGAPVVTHTFRCTSCENSERHLFDEAS